MRTAFRTVSQFIAALRREREFLDAKERLERARAELARQPTEQARSEYIAARAGYFLAQGARS